MGYFIKLFHSIFMYKLSDRNKLSPLNTLFHKPQLFEFYQAVRLLMQSVKVDCQNKQCRSYYPVGYDFDPKHEMVRFKAAPVLSFPISEILASHLARDSIQEPNELQVSFLGLYGPAGVLPSHYTELIIQRLQAKDSALRDFLDLFNHRIISLFYRSWEKHHFYVPYERSKANAASDVFTKVVASLIGNGTEYLQERTLIPDENYLYYAGFFACSSRSAWTLKTMLADYFQVPIELEQFQGKWLQLPVSQYTRLLSSKSGSASYNQLGCTTLLGQRSWNTQGYFKIKIGPVSYQDFLRYLPNEHSQLMAVVAMARRYIGVQWHFDIQLILKAHEVPFCVLSTQSQLGWNTWLKSKAMLNDMEDTIIKAPLF